MREKAQERAASLPPVHTEGEAMSRGTPEMAIRDYLEALGVPMPPERRKGRSRPRTASGVSNFACGVYLPLRTRSEANLRQHWAKRAKRAKLQRNIARYLVHAARPPYTGTETEIITLTRVAPRKLDSDNLARSLKAVRDGVADALGIDDGDARIDWRYAQRKGKPREYAVLIDWTTP